MPSYKLTYFNAKARAEITRLLFAQAGVEYEDNRIEGSEWATLKPTTPAGQLPILEVDGIVIAQSHTIARYVAREFKLAGSNNLEMAQCEVVVDTLIDINQELFATFSEKDEAKRTELRKTVFEEKTKQKLKYVEKMLIANGGNVFVGNTITIADIALFANITFMEKLNDDPLKDFPKLVAVVEKVGKEPRIAAWVAKRPVTNM